MSEELEGGIMIMSYEMENISKEIENIKMKAKKF